MPTVEDVWVDLVAQVKDHAQTYWKYHDYYNGAQKLPVDASEFRSRFGNVFSAFRANLARPVVDIAEGRLRFVEFGTGKGTASDALDIWQRNRMSAESKWVHTDALVMGDGFVMVDKDSNGDALIIPQSPIFMALVMDPENPRKKRAALKWWIEEDYPSEGSEVKQPYCRVNVYFEDRVEKFKSLSQTDIFEESLSRYQKIGSTRHRIGEVPVFRFAANWDQTLQDSRSDLADATGYIDAITKQVLDLLVASEYTAAPQRWATGVEIPLDPKTGEPLETYKTGADRLWTAPNEQARFGQFNTGEMAGFKQSIETLVDQLAYVTRTPVYAFMRSDTFPAGEALKTAEMPLRQRVADHQEAFGYIWAEVVRAALKVEGIEVEVTEVMPSWLPVNAPFATKELLEEVKVKVEVAGVPEEMAWRELGYSQVEIEEMKSMREEEATLGQDAVANLQADAIFNGAPPAQDLTAGLGDDTVDIQDPTLAPQ